MIEIMDQLSPVILESFVNVTISDTVSSNLSLCLFELCSVIFFVELFVINPQFPLLLTT